MAGTAVIEVAMALVVTVKVEAVDATEMELRALVERDPESVRGAILARVAQPGLHGEKEAGALDDDRVAFVTEVIDAEAGATMVHPRHGTVVIPTLPLVTR